MLADDRHVCSVVVHQIVVDVDLAYSAPETENAISAMRWEIEMDQISGVWWERTSRCVRARRWARRRRSSHPAPLRRAATAGSAAWTPRIMILTLISPRLSVFRQASKRCPGNLNSDRIPEKIIDRSNSRENY